jgi:hypothetical protein
VDITFNCNATNDSFRTTSTGLFQVDADTFVANIKQFRETDVLAADGRQWFHSEPAVIVNGEGPTTGTGTYYPFAWHGLDYLDGETNDTDKVVSSWDLQTNGPTDVHYLGDSLNALGLVAADSAIVGPIPKRHIRRQTFVDRFNPVIENAMDCQDNRVDNCRGLGFAPTGVLDVLTEPGIIDISGSYETQPGANTSFQPAVKYAPTIDLKGSGNFLTGYSQLFLSNALLELNPGNGTQMGRFITLFAAPRYANNTGGTVTFGAVNNGVDIQVTPEIINSPGGDISVNNWFHVQTSMSLDSGGFSANLRVGFDHGNMAAGMVVTRDIGVRVVASQAANNCGIAIGSPAFTGNWLGYVTDGNDSGVSLDTGTLQVRSYTDAATRPAVWDTNGNLIEGSPAATAFTEEVGDNFHNVSLQTTNDTWTEAIRIPTASGHEESGELRVRARRTTTGGSRRMTGRWATLTEMDGTLLVEYAALGTKLGNVNCDARVRADGSDIVIEVLGRPSQTWDWTVVYFRRPF